jgi:PAS domain S-box-containing protein
METDPESSLDPAASAGYSPSELERLRQDQRALSRALAEREGFYRTVLDSLAEGVLITNESSVIIFVNQRMAEVTGYSEEELLGKISYRLLAPEEVWPKMQRRLRERLSGKVEIYENELIRKDGRRMWIQVQASPYKNARGEIVGTVGALSCIGRQKDLEKQNEYLHEEIRSEHNFCNIVGQSPALKTVIQQIEMVAPSEASVLILGESGTGKELVARAVHENSPRRGKPLVRVNCASIPKELFESEFFGHVRGSFTGAIKDRAGRFELADGGTLFLDEVGEIPLELQGKLLRVLQEGQYERVGEERTRSVNVRVISATNRDLLASAKAGAFRLDLYYRLCVFPIELPPLRDRKEDIRPLAEHFLARLGKESGRAMPALTPENLADLEAYDWPGNVRELENVIERAVIVSQGRELHFMLGTIAGHYTKSRPSSVAAPVSTGGLTLVKLKELEKEVLKSALEQSKGRIYGPDGAAERVGLKPTTLISRLKKLGLVGRRVFE